jgi:hypothetical protein
MAVNPLVNLIRFGWTPVGTGGSTPPPATGTDYPHEPRYVIALTHPFIRFGWRPQGAIGGVLNTQTVSVTCTTTASFIRKTLKGIAISSTSTMTFKKSIFKSVSISSISSVVVSALASVASHFVTISVNCTSSVLGTASSILGSIGQWVKEVAPSTTWTKE